MTSNVELIGPLNNDSTSSPDRPVTKRTTRSVGLDVDRLYFKAVRIGDEIFKIGTTIVLSALNYPVAHLLKIYKEEKDGQTYLRVRPFSTASMVKRLEINRKKLDIKTQEVF